MSKLVIGAKVTYKAFNDDGKEVWEKGVIHGVTKVDTKSGPRVLAYLVDTGNDLHVDEVTYNERTVEMTKRVSEKLDKKNLEGDERLDAFMEIAKEVSTHKDLPKSKIVTETVRQPELTYVEPKDIKIAE